MKKNQLREDKKLEEKDKKLSKKAIIKEVCMYALVFFIALYIVPNYVAESIQVDGESMENTWQDNDRVMVEKISMQCGEIERFDVVVFDPHDNEYKYWIKRVIGLPGETVQIIDSDIYINGTVLEEDYGKDPIEYAGFVKDPYTLREDEYFVLGDNRSISCDSRDVGAIKKKDIGGKVCFTFWPMDHFGIYKK